MSKSLKTTSSRKLLYLHSVVLIPQNAVMVVIFGRIKPQVEPLFPACFRTSVAIYICLQGIGRAWQYP
ncbi:hypothetical protein Mapa_017405 [Marchantia paleacea]|nr:hypothetical protein Mapa_017405 [Marchantia paleacea]